MKKNWIFFVIGALVALASAAAGLLLLKKYGKCECLCDDFGEDDFDYFDLDDPGEVLDDASASEDTPAEE